ncbi:MAG TPA: RIP metalloprotease RseP [Longimicrobiales bacterium]
MLTTILATIVVLGVLIFVHELGHFITAKLVDIEVPRFSIGLGPKLWGFRHGETEYVISWLPLGGYVRMAGMEELEPLEGGKAEAEEQTGVAGATDLGLTAETEGGRTPGPRDFESKSLPARALVISAGVIMNILFAVLIFAAGALVWGIEIQPEARVPDLRPGELPPGAAALASVPAGTRIVGANGEAVDDWGDLRAILLTASSGPLTLRFEDAVPVTIQVPADDSAQIALVGALDPGLPPVLGRVMEGGAGEAAGLRAGDRIRFAAGEPVQSWQELVEVVQSNPGRAIDLRVERDGRMLPVRVVPEADEVTLESGEGRVIGRIGVGVLIPRERPTLGGAVVHGITRTRNVTALLVDFLGDLFTGEASPRSLGGPIMIGQLSGQVARAGLDPFLDFMALISINLAVLNLLPIPVLDGGQLLFLAIEAVRGRALSYEQRLRLTQVGIVIVVAIMVWAIANDVLRLFGL